MSIQAMSWVFDHSETTGAARLVMIGIANHVDPRGEGWAYVAEVLRAANVSEKSYHRAVAEAVDMGEVEVDGNAGGTMRMRGDRRPNLYRLPAIVVPNGVDNLGGSSAERGGQPVPNGVDNLGGSSPSTCIGPVLDPSLFGAEQARPPEEPTKPKRRKQDPIWDAVIDACGLAGLLPTRPERGAWNRAVSELRDVRATPDEISERARAHRRRWPNATLTPTSLARHWGELAAGGATAERGMTEAEYLAEKANPSWL